MLTVQLILAALLAVLACAYGHSNFQSPSENEDSLQQAQYLPYGYLRSLGQQMPAEDTASSEDSDDSFRLLKRSKWASQIRYGKRASWASQVRFG